MPKDKLAFFPPSVFWQKPSLQTSLGLCPTFIQSFLINDLVLTLKRDNFSPVKIGDRKMTALVYPDDLQAIAFIK